MSLFPAFSGVTSKDDIPKEESTSAAWLNNSSFPISFTSTSHEKPATTGKSKKRKKKRKAETEVKDVKLKPCETVDVPRAPIALATQDDSYALDTNRDMLLLKLDQQCKSARPRYPMAIRTHRVVAFMLKRRKTKKARYFSKKLALKSDQNDELTGAELQKTVESLNRAVGQDPHDIESWLRLIRFQDDYFKYQPIKYKTVGELERAIIQQKLAILERAMLANQSDSSLQKMWLDLAEDGCEYDEARSKLSSFIKKSGPRLLLCMGRVMLNQHSLARCTVPVVFGNYREAIEVVQKNKNLISSKMQDNDTLELLYYACQFMQQAGLWEMSWMSLKLSLMLNTGLELEDTSLTEAEFLEEENKILKASAGIPLWVLWGKLETLRQSHHFLPMSASDNFPQRVTDSDEVVDLVYHLRPNAHLRLLIVLLLLAKVPLLPRRHVVFGEILTQLQPWVFDYVEWHFSACFPVSVMFPMKVEYLKRLLPLQKPPQYLFRMSGQAQYFEFVFRLFKNTLNYVSGRQRVLIGVWYLRFLRWFDRLVALGLAEHCPTRVKTKTLFKDFLKHEQNRDTVLFFVEYALWAFENNDASTSAKTFETLIASKGNVLEQMDPEERSDLCTLYRSYAETLIASNKREEAKDVLQKMTGSATAIAAFQAFRRIGIDFKHDLDVESKLEEMLLPSFLADWSACYVWFLVLNSSADMAVEYLKTVTPHQLPHVREMLLEIRVLIHHLYIQKQEPTLQLLQECLKEFPLNSLFSSVMAEFLLEGGGLWWRNIPHLLHPPATSGAVLLAAVVWERSQQNNEQNNAKDNTNRCRALLKELATKTVRMSALLHRLRLKLLHELQDLEGIETARIEALEDCPWNKDLYLDCIKYCPNEMMNLTDVIVEKELRIHITPDELEAMRD